MKPLFNASLEDSNTIDAIAKRAHEVHGMSKMGTAMDLEACHCNGCPLRLVDLLSAGPFDFAHDVMGIQDHLNRKNGELMDHFLPRFSQPQP